MGRFAVRNEGRRGIWGRDVDFGTSARTLLNPRPFPRSDREGDPMPDPAKHCLLVVDDEPDVCDSVHDLLRREFRVLKATSAAEGIQADAGERGPHHHDRPADAQGDGRRAAGEGQDQEPQGRPDALHGYADLESIIAAINQGHVYQFLKKPWQPEELIDAVHQAAEEYDRLDRRRGGGRAAPGRDCGRVDVLARSSGSSTPSRNARWSA